MIYITSTFCWYVINFFNKKIRVQYCQYQSIRGSYSCITKSAETLMTHQSKITSDLSNGFIWIFPSFRTVWTCFTWDLRVFNLTSRGRDGTERNGTEQLQQTQPGPGHYSAHPSSSSPAKPKTRPLTRRAARTHCTGQALLRSCSLAAAVVVVAG
jgi:hypothetical protein